MIEWFKKAFGLNKNKHLRQSYNGRTGRWIVYDIVAKKIVYNLKEPMNGVKKTDKN